MNLHLPQWHPPEPGFANPNPQFGVPNADFKRLARSRIALWFTAKFPVPKAADKWNTLCRNYHCGVGRQGHLSLHQLIETAKWFPQAVSMSHLRIGFFEGVHWLRRKPTYPILDYLRHGLAALRQRECTCDLCLAQMEFSCGQYKDATALPSTVKTGPKPPEK